jgi:hypothetical protein
MGNSSKGSPGSGQVQTAAHDVGAVASCFGAGMSKLQGSTSAVKGSNSAVTSKDDRGDGGSAWEDV